MKGPLLLFGLAVVLTLSVASQDVPKPPAPADVIVLQSAVGTEGISAKTTRFGIDETGTVSSGEDYAVTGSISHPRVRGTGFKFTIDAISAVNLRAGAAWGAKRANGKIDRDNSGKLGVRGGNNGINAGEGFTIGLDATGLGAELGWQLTGIRFAYVGDGESYAIVNRADTAKRVIGDSDGMIDVSALGLFARGGSVSSELATVFARDTATAGSSGFRIVAFRLRATAEPVLAPVTTKVVPRMYSSRHHNFLMMWGA